MSTEAVRYFIQGDGNLAHPERVDNVDISTVDTVTKAVVADAHKATPGAQYIIKFLDGPEWASPASGKPPRSNDSNKIIVRLTKAPNPAQQQGGLCGQASNQNPAGGNTNTEVFGNRLGIFFPKSPEPMRAGLSFVNREKELHEMMYAVIANILRPSHVSKYKVLVSSQHLGSGKTILCSELCNGIAQLDDLQKREYLTQFNKESKSNGSMDALSILANVKHIYINLQLYEVLFRGHLKDTPLTQTIAFIVLDVMLSMIGKKELYDFYKREKQSDYDVAAICGIFEKEHPKSLLVIHLDEIDQILRIGAEPKDILPPEHHDERFHHLLLAVTSMANTKHTLYLSGRSPDIFKLGLGLPASVDGSLTTPEILLIISLVLDSLSAAQIAKLLPSDFIDTWREHFKKNNAFVTFEEYIVMRTGGVPRLVVFAYLYLSSNNKLLQKTEVDVLGRGFLSYLLDDVSGAKEVLSFTSLSKEDLHTYFRLAEWSYFQLPLKLAGKFDLSTIGGRDEVDLPVLLRRWQVYMEKVNTVDHVKYREGNEYVRLVFPAVVLDSAAAHPSYTEALAGTLLDNIRAQFNGSGHLWNPELTVELLPLKTITRHFCLPIGSNILGDHFPFFKKSTLEHVEMKILHGYRMPKMVVAEGSGGAKVLRTETASEPVSERELVQLRKNKPGIIEALEKFLVSPRGSLSTNLNIKDMELLRKVAPMNGYFTPTERSSSADAWIRWQVLLKIYELFIQAKSYQPITAKLVREEVDKVIFSADEHVTACFLIVSLGDNVPLDGVVGFEPILDGNKLGYRIPAGGTMLYIAKKNPPRGEKVTKGEESAIHTKGKSAINTKGKSADTKGSAKDKESLRKRKRTSPGASTPRKRIESEERLILPKNVEVIVLTADGVRVLLSNDTFDFLTTNLHNPPPISRNPSGIEEEEKDMEENEEGDDEEEEGDDEEEEEDDEDKEEEDDEEEEKSSSATSRAQLAGRN